MPRPLRLILPLLLAGSLLSPHPSRLFSAEKSVVLSEVEGPAPAAKTPDFKSLGLAALARIDADFLLPKSNFYAEKFPLAAGQPANASAPDNSPVIRAPSYVWPSAVQLSALVAASKVDKAAHLPALKRFIAALDGYWQPAGPTPGYTVLPNSKSPDRFYDDNAWLALALADAAQLLGDAKEGQPKSEPTPAADPAILKKSQAALAFVLSGEDASLGGGVYWRETKKASKNTCANAPAIVAALRLAQLTGNRDYLKTADRLYAWTNAHLQDTDGLYFDHINLDGALGKTKYPYNTALMIRANLLFYEFYEKPEYLAEAQRLAKAAEAKWIVPTTGAIADGSRAHMLCEAFLALAAVDKNPHWRSLVQRALTVLTAAYPDSRFADRWDSAKSPAPLPPELTLLHQASCARALLMFAATSTPK